jgi:hypothetical protein
MILQTVSYNKIKMEYYFFAELLSVMPRATPSYNKIKMEYETP